MPPTMPETLLKPAIERDRLLVTAVGLRVARLQELARGHANSELLARRTKARGRGHRDRRRRGRHGRRLGCRWHRRRRRAGGARARHGGGELEPRAASGSGWRGRARDEPRPTTKPSALAEPTMSNIPPRCCRARVRALPARTDGARTANCPPRERPRLYQTKLVAAIDARISAKSEAHLRNQAARLARREVARIRASQSSSADIGPCSRARRDCRRHSLSPGAQAHGPRSISAERVASPASRCRKRCVFRGAGGSRWCRAETASVRPIPSTA